MGTGCVACVQRLHQPPSSQGAERITTRRKSPTCTPRFEPSCGSGFSSSAQQWIVWELKFVIRPSHSSLQTQTTLSSNIYRQLHSGEVFQCRGCSSPRHECSVTRRVRRHFTHPQSAFEQHSGEHRMEDLVVRGAGEGEQKHHQPGLFETQTCIVSSITSRPDMISCRVH